MSRILYSAKKSASSPDIARLALCMASYSSANPSNSVSSMRLPQPRWLTRARGWPLPTGTQAWAAASKLTGRGQAAALLRKRGHAMAATKVHLADVCQLRMRVARSEAMTWAIPMTRLVLGDDLSTGTDVD